jgi:hypothetical protein
MIVAGTLSRYLAMRFLASVIGSLIGVIALAAMIDYVELMRRGADWPNATAWLLAKISMYRVPQLTERICNRNCGELRGDRKITFQYLPANACRHPKQ